MVFPTQPMGARSGQPLLPEELGVPEQMHIDDVAERVPALSKALRQVLACMSEGMSNRTIAEKLGLSNAGCVGTYVYLINKELGLTGIPSSTEKRQLAIDAFKKSVVATIKVPIALSNEQIRGWRNIAIDTDCAAQISALLTQGYTIETIEVVLRKPPASRMNEL